MELQLFLSAIAFAALLRSSSSVDVPENVLKLQKCNQSSTYNSFACDKAIDGITNQDFRAKSCSRVQEEVGGWWQAETDKPALFERVHIYNRKDCCGHRLTKFQISVNDKRCHTYDGSVFSVKFFSCFRTGMILRIKSDMPALTLCEVIAHGKYLGTLDLLNFTQSPVGLCHKESHGNTSLPLEAATSYSQVKSEATAWWKAETRMLALIEFFQIKQYCCSEKRTGFKITVDKNVCFEPGNKIYFAEFFPCLQLGRLLRIDSSKPFLTLCEIKVFGKYSRYDTRLKLSLCKQSSEDSNHVNGCEKAIDGDTSQIFLPAYRYSCSHTGPTGNGWWKAEVDKPALVEYVEIYTRKDCCADRLTDFTISVDGEVCYTHDGTNFSVRPFYCSKTGNVFEIKSKKPRLILCEVIVLGKYLELQRLELLRCRHNNRLYEGGGNCESALHGICLPVYRLVNYPWWEAETDGPALIKFVEVQNSKDCCDRPKFEITLDGIVCVNYDGEPFLRTHFRCFRNGTVLRIRSTRMPNMPFCKIAALGELLPRAKDTERARLRLAMINTSTPRVQLKLSQCRQSSQIKNANLYSYGCEKAIDGNTDGNLPLSSSCAHVGAESKGWWIAHTDRDALFTTVTIYNRQDCCRYRLKHFYIYIDHSMGYFFINEPIFSRKTFTCNKVGRRLTVFSELPDLTICEVIATGIYLE